MLAASFAKFYVYNLYVFPSFSLLMIRCKDRPS